MQFLYFIQQALVWIMTIYWVYQVVISMFSFVKFKDKPLIDDREHKFLAIIPAHNEEAVVGNLVKSLLDQEYPKDKLDIYVIADNCNDKTAQIARDLGVNVFERFEDDPKKKTKGAALNKFLGMILADPKKYDYDAFCVFDADNIVDSKFFVGMNKHLSQGEEVVQGYRDIKNPSDSWIAAGYALFYWTMHRFYHLARYNAGLSTLMNGTGFMVKMDVIRDEGWNTKTLTEDIEFSLKTIISGKKVGWATEAICYDEQPVQFGPSWTQRSRWTVGHIQCLKEYTVDLEKSTLERKTLTNLDGFLYLAGSIPMFIITILLLLSNAIIYLQKEMTTFDFLINILKYVIPTFLLPIFTAMAVMILDHRPMKKMVKGLLMYPIFMGSWLVINFKCLFKQNVTWTKIEHKRDVKIDEVSK